AILRGTAAAVFVAGLLAALVVVGAAGMGGAVVAGLWFAGGAISALTLAALAQIVEELVRIRQK
ncbi:MAG TPA: hypothetical protein VD838_00540, partial [Anaeromyxobacteraceae bacterium]|nr:hypothetical protein [Anaeromyxobacteraceae bacterium]